MVPKRQKLDDVSEDEVVQLELEGFSPQPEDRDGIIQLLKQAMPKDSNLSLGGIADYIIAHSTVGTVVKNCFDDAELDAAVSDDDNIIFSLTTVVSLTNSAASRSSVISDLRVFLNSFLSRAGLQTQDSRVISKILSGASSQKPALLLNERFVNLPPSIAAQAVAALPSEVQNLPDDERPTHLIILTRALRSEPSNDLIYVQPEMEIVRKVAIAAVEIISVDSTVDEETETITYVIMAIDFNSLPEILELLADAP
ncbi:unnamed protein product [Mesocestoides corti]|uniref:Protein BCCIP homolog n=1 Tax=Mesocestoides corti TaxID=53468 RepID=A0A0R3UQD6_MESCO|nr:unnamed protein product [Mesocestoides corti]